MKTRAVLAGVLILACAAINSGFQRPVPEPSPPALEALVFEPDVLDLGDVPINSSSDFESSLRNCSESLQKIDTVDAPCTCTSVHVPSKSLGPHEVTRISGVFRSGLVTGPISRMITVKTFAGTISKLAVRANVIRQITVDPPQIHLTPDFTEQRGDASETRIHNHSLERIEVAVSPPSGDLNVAVELGRTRSRTR